MRYHKIVGETVIHVWRDGVIAKRWHLTVRSERGTAHRFFWFASSAVSHAEWLALIIGDAIEAAQAQGGAR